ncbi:MAG: response regulator [Desulfobulbaceae bacterium]|nr:response regulator [Desulfobulbaceae bacterium]
MMADSQHPPTPTTSDDDTLLEQGEKILIVDDYPDIVLLLQEFLTDQGFPTLVAGSAAELRQALKENDIALILLDIGLPDANGIELLPELKTGDPDRAVIMLTAVTDLQTALDCLRQGADDYLTKPVQFTEFLNTLRKILEKRRLTINNRRYQKQIEQARFRIELLHELTMQMNSAYLSMTELDEILQAILVGITAEEGLQFNRAFLALFDDQGKALRGRLAIGPGQKEEGGRIWHDIQARNLQFKDLIASIKAHSFSDDSEVNRIVQALYVDASDTDHILIHSAGERKSINVINGQSEWPVAPELLGLLQEECFVVVPLYSPSRSLGVIIADHFVTEAPITEPLIRDLESFASQASLAIEHCHLYMAMENKIQELEAVTHELEQNRDLLVEAERYSAVGHMAAQLAHNIRNPITSIGGTARLLARKTKDPDWLKFLNMMTSEVAKIETTLEDLFSFVETVQPEKEPVALGSLLDKSLMLYYPAMQKQKITHELLMPEPEPVLNLDRKLIHQVFVHLIRNSVEAMPDGGTLTISVEQDNNEVRVILTDTGKGIADTNLDRATDPFFTTKTFGTGMGLTLVKRILKDHAGSLYIQRRESGGTRIIVQLPMMS